MIKAVPFPGIRNRTTTFYFFFLQSRYTFLQIYFFLIYYSNLDWIPNKFSCIYWIYLHDPNAQIYKFSCIYLIYLRDPNAQLCNHKSLSKYLIKKQDIFSSIDLSLDIHMYELYICIYKYIFLIPIHNFIFVYSPP